MADDFSAKYTNANLANEAAPYDGKLFAQFQSQLQQAMPSCVHGLSSAILIAMMCSQSRGDAAGHLFSDSLISNETSEVHELFSIIREALTICTGFVGLPNTMPAIFGMVAELKKRNIAGVESKQRLSFQQADWSKIGYETRLKIYHGVGNPEVAEMVAQYVPALSHMVENAFFGYAVAGCEAMPLVERELIVFASIVALGATRQAQSHCKAALQLGNTMEALQTIDNVAQQLAKWNGRPLPHRLNVAQLEREVKEELVKLET